MIEFIVIRKPNYNLTIEDTLSEIVKYGGAFILSRQLLEEEKKSRDFLGISLRNRICKVVVSVFPVVNCSS